jgi:nicotinate phosphoribosyltransferase
MAMSREGHGAAGQARARSSGLFTDFYELTMMQGYLQHGKADQLAVFDLFFRRAPHHGGFAVLAGIADAVEFVLGLSFSPEEIEYLRGLGLFDEAFLEYLGEFRFSGSIHGMPEGTVVFPREPLLRVEAPLPEAQLLESALLNIVNFQTLVATKAARVCLAAEGRPVMEFGLRRAQGPDGAAGATRAAFIGGCTGTSNTLAAHRLGIPALGTQAHSWVMSFPDELTAFRAYAESFPGSCILLVDTYDTLGSGVPHAITVARELRARGRALKAIRLDSGDIAGLAREARRMLDEAGFPEVGIVASGDLDEWRIRDLLAQGAPITAWGVGTRLVTSQGDPALGGVYKLTAVRDPDTGRFLPRMKLTGEPAKQTDPGRKEVVRFERDDGGFLGDVICLVEELPARVEWLADHEAAPADLPPDARGRSMLVPLIEEGRAVYEPPPLPEIQARCREQLARLPAGCRRLEDAQPYPVAVSPGLEALRRRLAARERSGPSGG